MLVIEHPARSGWTLGGTVKPAESTPAWHRFRLTVAPKTTATLAVEETASDPDASRSTRSPTIRWRCSSATRPSPRRSSGARRGPSAKAEIARLDRADRRRQSEIDTIGRDQERVRENMQALKGSGEERQLLQRYVRAARRAGNRIETLRRELEGLAAERTKAQAELTELHRGDRGLKSFRLDDLEA